MCISFSLCVPFIICAYFSTYLGTQLQYLFLTMCLTFTFFRFSQNVHISFINIQVSVFLNHRISVHFWITISIDSFTNILMAGHHSTVALGLNPKHNSFGYIVEIYIIFVVALWKERKLNKKRPGFAHLKMNLLNTFHEPMIGQILT